MTEQQQRQLAAANDALQALTRLALTVGGDVTASSLVNDASDIVERIKTHVQQPE